MPIDFMLKQRILLLLFVSVSLHAGNSALVRLCEFGMENNPKIRSYAHRVSASQSYYDQSVDRYKPQLNVSGQYGKQNYHYESSAGKTPYNGGSYNYRFSLTQPIYRAQLLEAMTDAKAKEKLTMLEQEDEKAKLVTQILQASVELIRQQEIIAILKKKSSLLEKAYDTITDRFNVQLAAGTEKSQSFAKLEQSRSDLIKAKQIYSYNLYNLRLLTKYEHVEKYIDLLSFNIPAVKKAFKKVNLYRVKHSIQKNTRILLDRQSTRIAKLQMSLRNSERAPNVDLVLSYGDSGGTIDYMTRRNDSQANLQVSFPLYQGGYVDDRVKEAKYLYLAAREDMENTRLNIKISMEKSLQDIKGGLASIRAQKSAVEASRKYFKGTMDSYKSGMQSLTDVYLAESDYYDNQLKLVNTEADVLSSLMQMYYFGGKASVKDVQKVQNKYFKVRK